MSFKFILAFLAIWLIGDTLFNWLLITAIAGHCYWSAALIGSLVGAVLWVIFWAVDRDANR